MFDTLATARRLTEAGMSAQQAEAVARTFREFAERQVTPELLEVGLDKVRAEMDQLATGLRAEIGAVRTELGAEIDKLRTEVFAEIGKLRTEMQAGFDKLRDQMRSEFNRAIVKLVLALAALWAATFFASLYFIRGGL